MNVKNFGNQEPTANNAAFGEAHQARQTPPQPEGRVIARAVQIDVREALDLHTGYSRVGFHEFLWLSGWRARVAVFVLKLLR